LNDLLSEIVLHITKVNEQQEFLKLNEFEILV